MLFLGRDIQDRFLDVATVEAFKTKFNTILNEYNDANPTGKFISPFENEVIRNSCSKNSFVIMDSVGHADSVVRIEVPHFDKCECIPLRKTPLFCSYNETLEFKRDDNQSHIAKFNLYRLRMMTMFVDETREEKIPADFVDITISSREDAELIDFWKRGRCVSIFERSMMAWVCIPDMYTCVNDLYKMLYVYNGPAQKKEKRLKKYEILKAFLPLGV